MIRYLKILLTSLFAVVLVVWLFAFYQANYASHQYTELSEKEAIAAEKYLNGKLAQIPAAWLWREFSLEPGVVLRTGMLDKENAKGTIVLVPGFTGSIEMAMRTIVALNQGGYRVAAIEYRGQGKSWRPLRNPEKGYVESYEQLAEDLAQYAEQVKLDDKPLFFFSISKGAHITMRMAAEESPEVAAYALVVPMIRINTDGFDYDRIETAAKFLSAIGLREMYAPGQSQWPPRPLVFGEATGCNANPATAQVQSALFAQEKELRTRGTTVQWLKETIASTRKLQSPDYMRAVTQPVKIFTAGDDRLVDTTAAQQFCEDLASCELTHFEDARHCINREDQSRMDKIISEALQFFDQIPAAY